MIDYSNQHNLFKFRDDFRKLNIGNQYSGIRHLLITSFIVLLSVIYSIFHLQNLLMVEMIIIPIAIILGNLSVYLIHRFPMHHKFEVLHFIFRNHTLNHHYLFNENSMEYENTRDFKMILLSPLLMFTILFFFILPNHLLFTYLFSNNVGNLFLMVSTLYMGVYEWMHLSFHTPKAHWVNRIPWVYWMRHHHTIHHQKTIMCKVNFNIVFPLCDVIFKSIPKNDRQFFDNQNNIDKLN